MIKRLREILATPFMVLATLLGFVAEWIYGKGYVEYVVQIARRFPNLLIRKEK